MKKRVIWFFLALFLPLVSAAPFDRALNSVSDAFRLILKFIMDENALAVFLLLVFTFALYVILTTILKIAFSDKYDAHKSRINQLMILLSVATTVTLFFVSGGSLGAVLDRVFALGVGTVLTVIYILMIFVFGGLFNILRQIFKSERDGYSYGSKIFAVLISVGSYFISVFYVTYLFDDIYRNLVWDLYLTTSALLLVLGLIFVGIGVFVFLFLLSESRRDPSLDEDAKKEDLTFKSAAKAVGNFFTGGKPAENAADYGSKLFSKDKEEKGDKKLPQEKVKDEYYSKALQSIAELFEEQAEHISHLKHIAEEPLTNKNKFLNINSIENISNVNSFEFQNNSESRPDNNQILLVRPEVEFKHHPRPEEIGRILNDDSLETYENHFSQLRANLQSETDATQRNKKSRIVNSIYQTLQKFKKGNQSLKRIKSEIKDSFEALQNESTLIAHTARDCLTIKNKNYSTEIKILSKGNNKRSIRIQLEKELKKIFNSDSKIKKKDALKKLIKDYVITQLKFLEENLEEDGENLNKIAKNYSNVLTKMESIISGLIEYKEEFDKIRSDDNQQAFNIDTRFFGKIRDFNSNIKLSEKQIGEVKNKTKKWHDEEFIENLIEGINEIKQSVEKIK